MILPITVRGVEYATSERLAPLLDAPATVAAVMATASPTKAIQIRPICLPYLSTFSTDLLENRDGLGRRQGRTVQVAPTMAQCPAALVHSQCLAPGLGRFRDNF